MRRRMICFFLAPLISSPGLTDSVVPNAAGKWTKEIQISQLTGETSLVWQIYSDNDTRGSLNIMKPAQMIIACDKNQTKVMFDFHDYMGSGDRRVPYRVDDLPVGNLSMGASEGGEALGLWFGRGVKWTKSLGGHKRLVVAPKAYNEPQVEAVFALEGINEVIATIGKACGW